MSEVSSNSSAVSGVVKWFDPAKGFGFVVSDSGGPDILLHVNVLRNYGQSSVADGAQIDLTVHKTDRGVQATQIHAACDSPGHGPVRYCGHRPRPRGCGTTGTCSGQMVRQVKGLWFRKCVWQKRRHLSTYRGVAPVGFVGFAAGRGAGATRDPR